MSFENRTAVVTGSGGGIGFAIAAKLAELGVAVTCVDLKTEPEDLPGGCSYIQADITDPGVPESAVESAAADGKLDFLVNAAGVGWFGKDTTTADLSDEIWDQVLAINLTAPMRFARAAIPAMRRAGSGAMVHIASAAGIRGMDEPMDAYQVSKAGLISLSRGIAVNHGPEAIRSNTICPGAIETPMVTSQIYDIDPSRRELMASKTPIRRVGTPEDIANSCAYLLSEEASFVTGTDAIVDGGWLSVLR